MTLVPKNKSKEAINKYDVSWGKIKDQIRTMTSYSDDYDKKHIKIKFNSDDDLPLSKTSELHNMAIAARAIFH